MAVGAIRLAGFDIFRLALSVLDAGVPDSRVASRVARWARWLRNLVTGCALLATLGAALALTE